MAKTIKIVLYSPRELWTKFCNWIFWPRRKQCAEWLDVLQVRLEHEIISDMLMCKYNAGFLDETQVNELDIEIKSIINKEVCSMKKLMSKPL